ncbi:MAG: outer membrane protein assembly factor BamE [Curvibacter sp.]|nr:outer membrane protein assembly factor BamE [Curvibacter sp.]
MSAYPIRVARLSLLMALVAGLAACSSFDGAGKRLANAVTPYRIEVVQGNFVSKEQVEALQVGMSRQQVKEVLGSPLVVSVFHADRWDYVFTLRRQGVPEQARRLTVYFKGDALERFDGDEMPSEAEFVAQLDARTRSHKVPELEASEAQLSKYPVPAPAGDSGSAAPVSAASASYPPLEPAAR